jgi:hypothetical protein
MSMSKQILVAAAAAAAVLVGSSAHATTLIGAITADNEYNAYLSTSDATLGTQLTSGANWESAQTFSANLTAGQTYYLHVVANNWYGVGDMAGGNPDALLASLSLSDTGFSFANGLQTLATDVANWRADPNAAVQNLGDVTTWTAPTDAPVSFGANGGSNIWDNVMGGPIAGVGSSAQWIWSSSDTSGEAFFSTTITTDALGGGVPEPAAWALMITGFGLTGAALRRRRVLSRTPALVRI